MKHTALFFCLLLLSGLWSTAVRADGVFAIGRPTSDIRQEYTRLKPIALYLAEHLKDFGISGGEVVLEAQNSIPATLELIEAGTIDLIFETPFSALRFIKQAGAVPLLVIEREGVTEYGSYIFARTDSSINSLTDLVGRIIAFEDAGSTSAYHLPRSALEEAGLQLEALTSPDSEVPRGKVGYVFAGSELNVSSWVYYRRADAGAISSLDWYSQDEHPEAFRKETKIIHETRQVPRMLVLARPGLAPELAKAASRVLGGMNQTEAGRKALAAYKINAFHPIEDAAAFIQELETKLQHEEMTDGL